MMGHGFHVFVIRTVLSSVVFTVIVIVIPLLASPRMLEAEWPEWSSAFFHVLESSGFFICFQAVLEVLKLIKMMID